MNGYELVKRISNTARWNLLHAAETVLEYFGFDRTLYGSKKNTSTRKWWWMEELRQKEISI